ncbi:MAG: glucosamine-6-phosphate deaminase [Planctomycetia bacterium]|nr:glucosamine-6-phosphate deaminase [Planctomycetia bacterium]
MMIDSGRKERLAWRVYATREEMGLSAAAYTEGLMTMLLEKQPEIRMIFAAAPSQNEMLAGLLHSPSIDWSRVTAFHMDEYLGLSADAPQGFGRFLRERLLGRLPFKTVHYLQGQTENPEAECARYATLLQEAPIDICCLGIGENGHIAFNDPPVADFHDPVWVKPVELDDVCRQQQVNDGCFASLDEVPTHALTLTIPALTSAAHMVCVVPAQTKRDAVRRLLSEEATSEALPASILRHHPHAQLFLDSQSGNDGNND